ncbi:MAG: hypothetical protein A3E25_23460 [Burkholderiales bacterium RIFCSPHIGHO2_12_FULL_69_20]|nr:MAG: hypothetical protein A3E25_23460 [Burkholderiales bacterium RIFCSPHIGHO2_12_FULL_69_20]
MNRVLGGVVFGLGLAAIAWVGWGYAGSHPLALSMTALIGTVYLMGALELRRFHQATSNLAAALAALPAPLPTLADWLRTVPAPLQNPVRLRIDGERIGLPGPAMTPYLVGLLVLLGMLGTFLGMVVTLNGAVMALESTTDLPTIRAALAAPVRGLGLAFGTSVAGVAASAMLGLLSALCRRERLVATQMLDTRIATDFHHFSRTHQRQAMLETLQAQAQAMPVVVDRLQAMMAQMERQSQALNAQLLAGQEGFHRSAQAVYTDLAASVDQSLRDSLTASAQAAGATIQPVVEATMAGITHETTRLHARMADTVQSQLDGLSERFGATVDTVSAAWTAAQARHQRSSEDLSTGLQASLAAFNDRFGQTSAALLSSVADAHLAVQGELKATTSGIVQTFTQGSASLLASVDRARADWQADLASQYQQRQAELASRHQQRQAELAGQDQQRLAALTQTVEAMAASLQREWQQAGAMTLAQQEQICKTLEQTAREVQQQAQAHARQTITEMSTLMQAASEAPRAAAEVMGLLRQRLSDSLAQDNTQLEERSRIMATLGTLLDAVNHAATGQRGAIDALVASSAALLQRVGAQFSERIAAESARMTDAATQITGSAVEVASLGEAFGHAVGLFGASSDALVAHLQRIEAALGKSTARSDEQLAYYVAQAREIIDLSIMSQRQIVDDLQQLAQRQAPAVGVAA